MRLIRVGLSFLMLLGFAVPLRSQTYITNGSATQDNCNCYTLTKAVNTQSGSVWNANKINLTQPFDFWFNVYLGCKDEDGADGMVFILQTVPSSVGTTGAGMGFGGVVPSIGITLDTWQNTDINDPPYDHISIQANGNINHGSDLAGPVAASAISNNIEDCQWHVLRISWDPAAKLLRSYFDGVLRVETTVDLVATIFNNDPGVYWGFSAGTGGSNNLQQFCTALNPGFTGTPDNWTTCIGNNTFTFHDASVSFAPIASYYWNFGDNQISTDANPPPHTYAAPGIYTVKLAITGFDGCKSDTARKTIIVGDYPVADFTVYDTCSGDVPRLTDHSQVMIGAVTQWNWLLDGVPVSNSQHPQLEGLAAGPHTLELQVTSTYGCASTPVQRSFIIKARPQIAATVSGACTGIPIGFAGQQLDNATMITGWSWDFGDGQTATGQNVSHSYAVGGDYDAILSATADNGCSSGPKPFLVAIDSIVAHAGNDTVAIQHVPFQLQGSGGGSYSWSPATGLSDPTSANPVFIPEDDIRYTLTVTSVNGCTDQDEVDITVFKGSNIYVPTGFTPNNDGTNDRLKPLYVGIKNLESFLVYNRWGQVIFASKNLGESWNGLFKGAQQPTGVYVWRIRAVDYVGKVYDIQGTTTLIR